MISERFPSPQKRVSLEPGTQNHQTVQGQTCTTGRGRPEPAAVTPPPRLIATPRSRAACPFFFCRAFQKNDNGQQSDHVDVFSVTQTEDAFGLSSEVRRCGEVSRRRSPTLRDPGNPTPTRHHTQRASRKHTRERTAHQPSLLKDQTDASFCSAAEIILAAFHKRRKSFLRPRINIRQQQ